MIKWFIDCALTKHLFPSIFPTVSPCGSLSAALPLLSSLTLPTATSCLCLLQFLSFSGFPPPSRSSVMGDHSLAVTGENIVDPGHQRADFGVNARVVGLSAALTPRDNTLQLAITHQRTAGVTLSREEVKEKFIPSIISPIRNIFYMFTDHQTVFCVDIPDKHPCLPPGIQRTPCGR